MKGTPSVGFKAVASGAGRAYLQQATGSVALHGASVLPLKKRGAYCMVASFVNVKAVPYH